MTEGGSFCLKVVQRVSFIFCPNRVFDRICRRKRKAKGGLEKVKPTKGNRLFIGGGAVRRGLATLLLATIALSSSGCYFKHLMSALFYPKNPTRTVQAEYELKADLLLILPYAGSDILFNYPTVPVEISQQIAMAIERQRKVQVKRIVNPARVQAFQDSNLDWPSMSLAEIGRRFKADKVLYIEFIRFSTLEPNSVNLLRGRVNARIEVIDVPERGNARPDYSADIEVILPKDHPVDVLQLSERRLFRETTRQFVDAVVKKFYTYKEKIEKGKR